MGGPHTDLYTLMQDNSGSLEKSDRHQDYSLWSSIAWRTFKTFETCSRLSSKNQNQSQKKNEGQENGSAPSRLLRGARSDRPSLEDSGMKGPT